METIIIEGELQNFDNSELLKHIEPAALAEAKGIDPHPTLKAFVVAHEGESKSHFVGIGDKVMKWFKRAVSRVYDVLKIGTPVFSGHAETNSTEGRKQVGKVVGKFQNMIGGVEKVVSIIQIFNPFKDKQFDIASFEGVVKIPNSIDNAVGENDLKSISGIALAVKSFLVKPAFPNADLIASVQMLENGGKKVELAEIRKAILEQKITPMALFSKDVILKLPDVTDAIGHAESKLNNQGEAFKRVTADRANALDEVKKRDTTINELNAKLKTRDAKDLFNSVIEERKIEDPKLIEFLKKSKTNLKIEDHAAEIKPSVNTFIDNSMKEYKDQKEFFIPAEKKPDEKTGDKKGVEDYSDFLPK